MAMKIEAKPFGTTQRGECVTCYCLESPEMKLRVLDYGATVQSVQVRDKNGAWTDVVLGYDTLAEYELHDGYLGACVGRVANRLGGAQFQLNGRVYPLARNDGENHLHGGLRGFDKYVWQALVQESGVQFTRLSPDGEEGYPGNLHVSVTYRVEGKTLSMIYDADTDQDTLCNLTNHSYWNLNGGGTVEQHTLQIDAAQFLENSAACMPTGKVLPVAGTPFDFREPKKIGQDIEKDDVQLKNCGGYDHNFCLPGDDTLREAAALCGDQTGISMRVSTTMPGMQLYTANFLGPWPGKGRAMYDRRFAACLETQFYPNAMQCDGFRKPIVKAGEHYHHVTEFSFSNDGKERKWN